MVKQILPNNNEKCYRNFSPKIFTSKHALIEVHVSQMWQLYPLALNTVILRILHHASCDRTAQFIQA
jgi:hypothetical protein